MKKFKNAFVITASLVAMLMLSSCSGNEKTENNGQNTEITSETAVQEETAPTERCWISVVL